jgi:REP element-mobilizing transposase RayT
MSIEIRHRVGLPKGRFHVFNRGARKVAIFDDDDDRRLFVHLLAKFTIKYQIRLIAWCLMANHYHLEPEGEGTPLTRMMHDLDGTYAKIYNQRHEGSGCLFQGRFKSTAIQDEDGLAYVSRYIHANPLAFGARPEDYPWSSCRSFLGLSPTPDWLDPTPVLELMGENPAYQRDQYALYLQAAPIPRKKHALEVDDREEFFQDFIRHLEAKLLEAMRILGNPLRDVSTKSVVSWMAHRRYRLPAASVANYFAYQNANVVRVNSVRFAKRLDEDPLLAGAVRRANELVARFH